MEQLRHDSAKPTLARCGAACTRLESVPCQTAGPRHAGQHMLVGNGNRYREDDAGGRSCEFGCCCDGPKKAGIDDSSESEMTIDQRRKG